MRKTAKNNHHTFRRFQGTASSRKVTQAVVAGVTFSDSDSAHVTKILNPGPGTEIFQI